MSKIIFKWILSLQSNFNHLIQVKKIFLHLQSNFLLLSSLKNFPQYSYTKKKLFINSYYTKFFNHHRNNMTNNILSPPEGVKGMTILNKENFKKEIDVPALIVPIDILNNVIKLIKKFLLKIPNFNPVIDNSNDTISKILILNPNTFNTPDEILSILGKYSSENQLELLNKTIELNYENWSSNEVLKAVLPDDQQITSFSHVGHILHLNLKDFNLPFKNLIGEVLLDKKTNCSLVVNKLDSIDNTFRTFEMEVLAGKGEMVTTVSENGVFFTFDFSKVYWNPRLSTEHQRIVDKLDKRDILFDVMAGVGPFSIPAAKKKKSIVYANDLNPHSYEYLIINSKKNKVEDRITCFNMDGNEFIKSIIKKGIVDHWADENISDKIHITMNLPALAIEFLPTFLGLITEEDCNIEIKTKKFPLIYMHVYFFSKDNTKSSAIEIISNKLNNNENIEFSKDANNINSFSTLIDEVVHVRSVAPNSQMMRVSFLLSKELLINSKNLSFTRKSECQASERPSKIIKSC